MKTTLFLKLLSLEYRLFSSTKSIVTIVLGGVVLYAVLYNFMYLPEVVREVPVAVVDEDNTSQSRGFVRALNATPQVEVTRHDADAETAREAMRRGEVQGVVRLPRGYSGRGETIYIMWGNTSSLLTYAAVQEAVVGVAMARRIPSSASSLTVVGLPLFNPTGGYGSYLIPVVLMVILFQTLLMAAGIRLGTDREQRYRKLRCVGIPRKADTWTFTVRLVMARWLLYVTVYAVMAFFLVALVPRLFDLPQEGGTLALVVLMGLYLVASAAFALACIPFFRDPEGPLVGIAFCSVGYLFLSGTSYPLECMPLAWQLVRILFPVCPATLAYVQVNTMGATLGDISSQLLLLFLQTKVYISVALLGQYSLLKSTFHYGFLKNPEENEINFRF